MTSLELAECTGARLDRATTWLAFIEAAMAEYSINTDKRKAAFLAQIGHESCGLHYSTEIWGPTPTQSRYEGRIDLGNTQPGDGSRFRGRGLIQITGRANYEKCGKALSMDLIGDPEALANPSAAARSAAWFWSAHGCNEIADSGDFEKLTKRINGGLNGYQNRCDLWAAAKEVFA